MISACGGFAMRKLAFCIVVAVVAAFAASESAFAGGRNKTSGSLSVRIDKALQVRIRNNTGVAFQKVTLSLSVVKTNGVAVESAVEITDLAADGSVPAKIRLPNDGAKVARIDVIGAVAHDTEARRVVPEVELELAH